MVGGMMKSILLHLLIVGGLVFAEISLPKKNKTPMPEVIQATLVEVEKPKPKPQPKTTKRPAVKKQPVKKVTKTKPKPKNISTTATSKEGLNIKPQEKPESAPKPEPKGPTAAELAAEKAKKEAEQKALAQQQAARKRHVLSELQKYQAMIKSTIQRNLLVDEAFRGKRCILEISLARSGFVTKVNEVDGDDAVCRAAKNAVLKAETLPVSDEVDVYQELREIRLTVEPEL